MEAAIAERSTATPQAEPVLNGQPPEPVLNSKPLARWPDEQRFLLGGIDWQGYLAISGALDERHIRVTYDQGRLELMTVSALHGRCKGLLGLFVWVLTEELDRPRDSCGSMTLRREGLARALEPDNCYYLDNEPLVRNKELIDLEIDPPPDLAIESEISRSALDRMGIYAALRVPEVWRSDGETLCIHHLTAEGTYVQADHSRYFPFVPIKELERFLLMRREQSETAVVKAFRIWVREQLALGWPKPA